MSQITPIFNSFNYCLLQERLVTYKNWPFSDDVACSAQKMAEAGFYQPNPYEEPDLAKCFVCMKELDGWEENDDPWKEHEKHQNSCEFVEMKKKPSEITLDELLTFLQASVLRSVEKINKEKREKMDEDFQALSKALDKKWKRKK